MSPHNSAFRSFFAIKMTSRHKLTKRRTLLGVGALVGLAVLLAYRPSPVWSVHSAFFPALPAARSEQPRLARGPRPVRVVTVPVRAAGPASMTQRFTGIVNARRMSTLSAKSLGRVERIAVDIGDHVRPGEVLVELDRDQLAAERRVVAANGNAAQARLAELQAGPRAQDIARAESAVREAQANLELREASFRRVADLENHRHGLRAGIRRKPICAGCLPCATGIGRKGT